MNDDPRLLEISSALRDRTHVVAEREPGRREAAVALIVRPAEQLEVLLIRRAELPGDPWSGHVALPGGRHQPSDPNLFITACRESSEEVGIALDRVGALLGPLDEVAPTNPLLPPILIAPFVVAVPPETHATPDPREVAAAVWVPVRALSDPAAVSDILVEHGDMRRRFPALVYEDYHVWGLTYRILLQFLEVVR